MKPQRNSLTAGLVIALFAIGVAVIWSANARTSQDYGATTKTGIEIQQITSDAPITLIQPPSTCHYCNRNLVGKSPTEISQFAQNLARQQLKAKGPVQALLTRAVNDQELAALGLGCGPSFTAIEQPPLVLTILKGEFDFRGAAPGFGRMPPPVPSKSRYVVYVFDAWAGSPAMIMASEDGSLVKKALQDSALPDNTETHMPTTCATPIPASQKQMHYGDTAPGFDVPTHTIPESTPVEATPWIPLPVPTASTTIIPVNTVLPTISLP